MTLEPLFVSNRVVAFILPTAVFVEWINAADPTDDSDDLDHPGVRWIQRNWKMLFERA